MGEKVLFHDFERTNIDRSDHSESTYTFLNNSAWKIASTARDIFEIWVQDFPYDKHFLSSFKSTNNQKFNSALFELFIHQYLLKLTGNVEKTDTDNSTKYPDFKCTTEAIEFYIECLSVAYKSSSIQNSILDKIESIHSPQYIVSVNFEKTSFDSPSIKRLGAFLEKSLKEAVELSIFKTTWSDKEWRLSFSFYPRNQESKSLRTLAGIRYGAAQFINSKDPLMKSLHKKKGSSYSLDSKPYIIAINSDDGFLDELDIMRTLYGSFCKGDEHLLKIGNESFFYNKDSTAKNTSVSAVIIFRNLNAWNMDTVKVAMWHNPNAKHPLSLEALSLEQNHFINQNELSYRKIKKGIHPSLPMEIMEEYSKKEKSTYA
jgi:hypothetical protein